ERHDAENQPDQQPLQGNSDIEAFRRHINSPFGGISHGATLRSLTGWMTHLGNPRHCTPSATQSIPSGSYHTPKTSAPARKPLKQHQAALLIPGPSNPLDVCLEFPARFEVRNLFGGHFHAG